jgi:hypothetical protein
MGLQGLLLVFDTYLPKWFNHIQNACFTHDCDTLIHTVRAMRNFSLLLSAERLVCMSDQLCELMQDRQIDEQMINQLLQSAQETQAVLQTSVNDLLFSD